MMCFHLQEEEARRQAGGAPFGGFPGILFLSTRTWGRGDCWFHVEYYNHRFYGISQDREKNILWSL